MKKPSTWMTILINLLVGWGLMEVLLAIPATVSAQPPGMAGYGYGYLDPGTRARMMYASRGIYPDGYYDPYFYRDSRDFFGRELPPIDVEICPYVECLGRKGTFHAEGGIFHFRPWDSTHHPKIERHGDCIPIRSIGQTAIHGEVKLNQMPQIEKVAPPPPATVSLPRLTDCRS